MITGSARNNSKERLASVRIRTADLEKNLVDGRTSMRRGTLAQTCTQHGVSVMQEGKHAVLTARRDRLQLVVELLHYCCVDYSVVS